MIGYWEEFISDIRDLRGRSKDTLRSYGNGWNAWGALLPLRPTEITQDTIKQIIRALDTKGTLSPISINTYLRVLRAFVRWMQEKKYVKRVLKIPQRGATIPVMRTFTDRELEVILNTADRKLLMLTTLAADTGLRAKEALTLRCEDVLVDDYVLIVREPKNNEQRFVPMSQSVTRSLAHFIRGKNPQDYIFQTRTGTHWSYRNALRKLHALRKEVNNNGRRRFSFHTFRATFATTYADNNGDEGKLMRIMGHKNFETTLRYINQAKKQYTRGHDQKSVVGKIKRRY